ncbi:MAG: hypothetical protein ABI824_10545 [Acidobacteriota bacterium]
MSYLDNLENNLNALERLEEKDPEKVQRDREQRDTERTAALARAPHADDLRSSEFTSQLLTECRAIGHAQRVLVQFAWIGENLRLDAKTKRMEMVPTPDGVVAVFSLDGVESHRAAVDLATADAAALAKQWLTDPNLP